MKYEQELLENYINDMGEVLDKTGKAFQFDDLVYEALNLVYGNKTVGERIKQENTLENTYFYSYLLALSAPNSHLIKGYIKPSQAGISIPHAWVEKDEFVYDVAFKRVFYKDFYQEYFNTDYSVIFVNKALQKLVNQFNVGLQTVKNDPKRVNEFLSYKNFKNIKKTVVVEMLELIKDKSVYQKVAEFYDIDATLEHNINVKN